MKYASIVTALGRWYIAPEAPRECDVSTIDERVADLETRVEKQAYGMGDLAVRIDALGERLGRVETLCERLDHRIDGLDRKIESLGTRLDGRIDALDQKLDRRLDALDYKVDRFREELSNRITWVAGTQVATLIAIVGVLLSVLFKSS